VDLNNIPTLALSTAASEQIAIHLVSAQAENQQLAKWRTVDNQRAAQDVPDSAEFLETAVKLAMSIASHASEAVRLCQVGIELTGLSQEQLAAMAKLFQANTVDMTGLKEMQEAVANHQAHLTRQKIKLTPMFELTSENAATLCDRLTACYTPTSGPSRLN